MIKLPCVGDTWLHYKGGRYTICDLVYGAEGEDLEIRVVYTKNDVRKFSRPIADFVAPVADGVVRFAHLK